MLKKLLKIKKLERAKLTCELCQKDSRHDWWGRTMITSETRGNQNTFSMEVDEEFATGGDWGSRAGRWKRSRRRNGGKVVSSESRMDAAAFAIRLHGSVVDERDLGLREE